MGSRTLAICLYLTVLAALALWGVWSWGPGAFDRHLAAAERALASGGYERAVQQFTDALALEPGHEATRQKLELAQALVESDLALARGREALQAGEYATAEGLFATVRPEHPSYAEAQRLAAQCRLADFCAFLSRDWAVARNLPAGEFTLTSPGEGTVKLVVIAVDDAIGVASCSLEFAPLPGTVYPFPWNLTVEAGDPFPVDVAGEGRFVVGGSVLWVPPEDPVAILPAGGRPIGWALSSDGELLAGTCVLTAGSETLVATVVTDLATLEAVFVDGPYSPGASMPPDWHGAFAEVIWTGPRQIRYERFEGEGRFAEVRYEDLGK